MPNNKHIVVVGTVGVGKSTFVHRFTLETGSEEVKMDELYQSNPFFPLTVQNRRRWSLASDLWFLKKRLDIYSTIPAMLQNSSIVVDSGIPMSLAYVESRLDFDFLTREEYNLYQLIAGELLKNEAIPDEIIHLRAPLRIIKERIKKRGRQFELKYFTDEYIESVGSSIEKILDRYHKIGSRIIGVHY